MAKKGFEILRPQHDEYVEQFEALSAELREPDEVMVMAHGLPREMIIKQVDHLLDKHALDYPEMVISWQLGRLLTEAEALRA